MWLLRGFKNFSEAVYPLCKRINFIMFHVFLQVYGVDPGAPGQGPLSTPVYTEKRMENDEIYALTEGGIWLLRSS